MKSPAIATLVFMLAVPAVAQLTPGATVSVGAPFPITADFNGDGLDDLIQEKNVVLNRNGVLDEVRPFGFGDERVIGAPDVNGDGVLDLLTEGTPVMYPAHLPQPPMSGPGYRLYIGDASRNYPSAIDISGGYRPHYADVDADGRDDLVILAPYRPDGFRETATDVTVLRSRGDGSFESLPPFRMPALPQTYPNTRLLSGDFNHDGNPDIVVRCTEDLVLLLGEGGGSFTVQSRHLPGTRTFGTQSARIGDVDGDGNLDVILQALRGIRVLLGDGKGNFPRTIRTEIPKLHEIELPKGYEFLVPKHEINEPRNLAVGHFTRNDRTQIAAGTLEGDLVIYSFENGALREVARNRTEFWHVDVRTGAFSRSGMDDVYAGGTLIWGEPWPKPRVFFGRQDAQHSAAIVRGRGRGVRAGAQDVTMTIEMQGECVTEPTAPWRFARDGVFGLAKRGDTTIEAVFDAPSMYVRVTAPYLREPATIALSGVNGPFTGSTQAITSCGMKPITVTAKSE